MSLLVLMYHQARAGRFGNAPEMLDAHFAHIAQHYANVLPGDAPVPGRLNVCLSFDDAYFDFYAIVFPLLKKHGLRAQLAVAPAVLRDRVDVAPAERLAVEAEGAFSDPGNGAFCTWSELAEMARSGHVAIAAHGFTHRRLDDPEVELSIEIDAPRAILESRLGQAVDSFVFPFGRYSPTALQRASGRYRHVFRIGGALNCQRRDGLLYRVDADAMKSPRALFSPARAAGYRARWAWNRMRGR